MPPTPKSILKTAIEQGRKAVGAGIGIGKRFRRDERDTVVTPSGPAPAEPAPKRPASKPASGSTGTGSRAKRAPRSKPGATERTPASEQAASSGDDVKDAAKP